MGREWELSYRLGMRPWIAVAYSAPVAAATAVFLIYPIGQGSFSDGMPLGKVFAPSVQDQNLVILFGFYFITVFSKSKLLKVHTIFRTIFRNNRQETRLNGEPPLILDPITPFIKKRFLFVFFKKEKIANPHSLKGKVCLCQKENKMDKSVTLTKDNPVSNQTQPRKQPGLYMVRCLVNDCRYYGESGNISGRIASHKSLLTRKIHPNSRLQRDWNIFGKDNFDFVVLFMGPQWEDRKERQAKETLLIVADRYLCYNYLDDISQRPGNSNPFFGRKHSEQTKKKIGDSMRNIPNDTLGKAIRFNEIIYASIAAASRATGCARKTIRKRLNDPTDLSCTAIEQNNENNEQ